MSDSARDRARRLKQKVADLEQDEVNLRRRIADSARSVADTEEDLADTMERIAEDRSPADAARLRAIAEDAKEYAAKERHRSARYGMRSGDDGADEHGGEPDTPLQPGTPR